MEKVLLFNRKEVEIEAVVLINGEITEKYSERIEKDAYYVGGVYIGVVKKIYSESNAVFVDIGREKNGFLNYQDLGFQFSCFREYSKAFFNKKGGSVAFQYAKKVSPIPKRGLVSDFLKPNDMLFVQIKKDEERCKGNTLSASPVLASSFVIVIPFGEGVRISSRIRNNKDRERLTLFVRSFQIPKNYGLIIRTAAQGQSKEIIWEDIKKTINKWEKALFDINKKESKCVIPGMNLQQSLEDRIVANEFQQIINNDSQWNNKLVELKKNKYSNSPIITVYNKDINIFSKFDIYRRLEQLLGTFVALKFGHIVIEKTYARWNIDINSGSGQIYYSRRNKLSFLSGKKSEEIILEINLLAAKEISRQIILRNMGGYIWIDFITMSDINHLYQVRNLLISGLAIDRFNSVVHDFDRGGGIGVIRERVKKNLQLTTTTHCPTCCGTGKLEKLLIGREWLKNNISSLLLHYDGSIFLFVHEYFFDHLTKGWLFSYIWSWRWHYKRSIYVHKDFSLPMHGFRIEDNKGGVLRENYMVK